MSSKRYISLPKSYLSYSQYMLWTSNPQRYKNQYFDKRDDLQFTNTGQTYGKFVADALEAGRETNDLLTDSAILLLPKYDVADVAIEAEFKEKGGCWLKVIAKPDSFNSMTHEFMEFKTGKEKNSWTQAKAQSHIQMIWYAVVIWLKYGTMLDHATLAWIATEDTPLGIKPTGRVESFEVTFKPEDYYSFQARMLAVAHEIEQAWAAHETKEWLTTF